MAITMLVFGREIERALQPRCVTRLPLEVNKRLTSDVIAVEPGRGCQVGVELVVSGSWSSVLKDLVRGEPEYWFRYRFPLSLYTLDEAGDVALTRHEKLVWDDGTRRVRDERVDASGGRARVLHVLPKFEAPASGKLRVRAFLSPDTEFGATAESAELRVYDNITRPHDEMVMAAAALLFGPAVMMLGVVLGIAGWLRRRRADEAEAAAQAIES